MYFPQSKQIIFQKERDYYVLQELSTCQQEIEWVSVPASWVGWFRPSRRWSHGESRVPGRGGCPVSPWASGQTASAGPPGLLASLTSCTNAGPVRGLRVRTHRCWAPRTLRAILTSNVSRVWWKSMEDSGKQQQRLRGSCCKDKVNCGQINKNISRRPSY